MAEESSFPGLTAELDAEMAKALKKFREDTESGSVPIRIDYDNDAPSLVGTGASVYLNQNHVNSVTPDTRNIITMSPEATILVKKKAFSSLKGNSDLSFIDKSEKMLLRATKALFAYKVQQIRAYESLTKFRNYLEDNKMYSLNLLSSFLREGSLFNVGRLSYTEGEYVEMAMNKWLGEIKGVQRSSDGGYIYIGPNGQSVHISEAKMADAKGNVSPGASPAISILLDTVGDGSGATQSQGVAGIPDGATLSLSIPLLTNKEYLSSIPASTSKVIIENMKASFRDDYNGNGKSSFKVDSSEVSAELLASDIFDTSALGYEAMNEDIAKVLRRNAFSTDNQLTTWVVDHEDPTNYTLGPGTGVIELTMFSDFRTSINNETAPSTANFNLTYPYRIGTVLEGDIDLAVEEALNGTVGILDDLVNGGLRSEGLSGGMPPIDGPAIISAALEQGGAGSLDASLDMNYVRERLRTFYLGKPIVNPPDPVHFYIRGNRTFTDYTQSGVDGTCESPFDDEYMEIDTVILKAEHQLYTNQAMDLNTYKELRKRQDNSFGMIHVFGGYVTNTSEAYSSGFWNLAVSCTDNMSWLKWSRFAIKPAQSDPQGILEDPLTPFDLVKDDQGKVVGTERELLHENKALLQSGLLSYDSGILAGQNATEGNLLQGQYSGRGSLRGKKIMQHPGGFVYRWKTGVITSTAGFQIVNPAAGDQSAVNTSQQYVVTAANDVLNNLDIPNILSILVVGQPYNVETFIEQSTMAHNKGNKSNKFSIDDPLTGVVDTIRKQNQQYGDFHPYRMLTVSAESAEQMVSQAGIRSNANTQVKNLQRRKVKLRTKMRSLAKGDKAKVKTGVPASALIATLQAEINSIDSAIQEQIRVGTQFSGALTSSDEVGIQISLFGISGMPVDSNEEDSHDINRALTHIGAQRRIEDVRLNRDRNLFIVSDQYDSADIRPFILALNNGGFPLFKGTFVDTFEKCKEASGYLHLEFFANSQGHLEFRPPLWNRTPLSILKEVIRTQNETGREVMPTFITNLFQTRIEALYLSIHTLNVKIALLALLLGRYPDYTLIPNMKLAGPASLDFFGVEAPVNGGVFGDIANFFAPHGAAAEQTGGLTLKQREFSADAGDATEQNNSLFGDGLRVTAAFQDNGDVLAGNTESLLGVFDPIFQEEAGVVNDLLTAATSSSGGGSARPPAAHLANDKNLNNIRNMFKKQFGRDPAKGIMIDAENGFGPDDFMFGPSMSDGKIDKAVMGTDGILDKLKKAISARDSYVSMLQANLSKKDELEEIAGILSTGESSDDIAVADGLISGKGVDFLENLGESVQSTVDIITGDANEGTVFDHLIEDDTRNMLGYGSGKRYILKDEYIISATFTESPPDFTRINVQGDAPLGMGGSLDQGTEGMYFWAGATDFDMWRQYGYRSGGTINVPFISDTEGQAKPYAIMELMLQRMNINRGEVSVSGNEFYQPGDTIYIPTKGLLYYIRSVGHSFSYIGQTFTTQLSLVYGHAPGEYLPSPLDVIGQDLVANFLDDPAIIYRSEGSDDNYRVLNPDSTLVFPSAISGGTSMAELLDYNDNQVRFTNMMMDVIGSLSGTKYLLIRGFVKNADSIEDVNSVNQKMALVRSLFENPSQISQNHAASGAGELFDGISAIATGIGSMFGGGSAPTSKSLTQMRLPNNMPVIPIRSTKIIEQISYMSRDDAGNYSGEIRCMDRNLVGAFNIPIDSNKAAGVFPKGGPSQGSWMDFRDELSGANFAGQINIIEVGIINIPNSVSG